MFHDSERKDIRRKDAIYNPIEGRWEKRNSALKNENVLTRLENQLEFENIKTAIKDIKKNAIQQAPKLFAGSEKEDKAAEKNETLMIIKLVIAVALLIIAAIN